MLHSCFARDGLRKRFQGIGDVDGAAKPASADFRFQRSKVNQAAACNVDDGSAVRKGDEFFFLTSRGLLGESGGQHEKTSSWEQLFEGS